MGEKFGYVVVNSRSIIMSALFCKRRDDRFWIFESHQRARDGVKREVQSVKGARK